VSALSLWVVGTVDVAVFVSVADVVLDAVYATVVPDGAMSVPVAVLVEISFSVSISAVSTCGFKKRYVRRHREEKEHGACQLGGVNQMATGLDPFFVEVGEERTRAPVRKVVRKLRWEEVGKDGSRSSRTSAAQSESPLVESRPPLVESRPPRAPANLSFMASGTADSADRRGVWFSSPSPRLAASPLRLGLGNLLFNSDNNPAIRGWDEGDASNGSSPETAFAFFRTALGTALGMVVGF
jgi:hypothetical protein